MKKNNKILVIGLGNPILGDDGLGWRVAEEVERQIKDRNQDIKGIFDFEYYSLGGLSLMEYMEGYDNVLIVDSIVTGQNPVGTILSLPLNALPDFSSGHSTAAHDTSLQNALEIGKKLGISLPETIWIVVIEAEFVYDFSETLSKPIQEALPKAVEYVVGRLVDHQWEEKEIVEVSQVAMS